MEKQIVEFGKLNDTQLVNLTRSRCLTNAWARVNPRSPKGPTTCVIKPVTF